jgi:hypothetical protein
MLPPSSFHEPHEHAKVQSIFERVNGIGGPCLGTLTADFLFTSGCECVAEETHSANVSELTVTRYPAMAADILAGQALGSMQKDLP